MEPVTDNSGDRRSSYRVPVSAAAAVRTASGFASTYAVDDLSLGGALLRGTPVISKGQSVRVAIRCVGSPVVSVAGRVVRHSGLRRTRPRWAIRFWEISAEAEDAIHDLSVAVLERAPTVLLLDRSARRRAKLTAQIRSCGLRPLAAATLLEAISLLQAEGSRIESVVVGRISDPESWLGFLGFLRHEYPEVRRVVWSVGARRLRRADEPADDDSPPAEAVIFDSSDRGALERALLIRTPRRAARRA